MPKSLSNFYSLLNTLNCNFKSWIFYMRLLSHRFCQHNFHSLGIEFKEDKKIKMKRKQIPYIFKVKAKPSFFGCERVGGWFQFEKWTWTCLYDQIPCLFIYFFFFYAIQSHKDDSLIFAGAKKIPLKNYAWRFCYSNWFWVSFLWFNDEYFSLSKIPIQFTLSCR